MNLLKLFFAISGVAFLSRFLGFIRDLLIAYFLGASIESDIFFTILRIPNLFRKIFAEGVFSQAFVPILSKYFTLKKKKKKTKVFFSEILGFLTIILFILVFLGVVFSNFLVFLIFPKFFTNKEKFILSVRLLHIFFPYIFFIALAAFFSSILNIYSHFILSVFSSVFLNISIIFFMVFFSKFFKHPIFSLSWSMLISGFLQFIFYVFYMKKKNFLFFPRINFFNIKTWSFFKNLGVCTLGIFIGQLAFFFNGIFSSSLPTGSISWMYYSERLIEVPSSLLSISINTILLPYLSNFKKNCNRSKKEYFKMLNWSICICFLVGIPSAIELFVLSNPIITVLFQYGNFTKYDTKMTALTLMIYSIGLIAFILIKILTPIFYAFQDIYTPVKTSLLSLIITQIMNFFLIKKFFHLSLVLSISMSSWLNLMFLTYNLYYKKNFFLSRKSISFLKKVFISIIIMLATLLITVHYLYQWREENFLFKLIQLMIAIILSVTTYIISLFFLGIKLNLFLKKKNDINKS